MQSKAGESRARYMKIIRQVHFYVSRLAPILIASALVSCSGLGHGTRSHHNVAAHTGAPPITPSVIPTRLPSSPADVDSFRTADGKIRCYFPLLEGEITEGETGLWCFSDNNGPNGQDCRFSPGPSAVHMPIDGQPIYYPCAAENIKESALKQGTMPTILAGSVVDIGSNTCHIKASGTLVLCAGYIEQGFSISSSGEAGPKFYNNCKTSDMRVECISPAGRPVS